MAERVNDRGRPYALGRSLLEECEPARWLTSIASRHDDESMIPECRPDRFLPEGLHVASEADVTFRFGSTSSRRQRLALRLRRWTHLAREVHARRLLMDGSFVSDKPDPNDIDAVIHLPEDFQAQIERGSEPALELEHMLLLRHPEEIFAAEDESDWNEWVEFFGRTHEADGRRKGLVEIAL